MESKYLIFKFSHNKPRTSVYDVLTKDEDEIKLGTIKWYAHWRQYGFFPEKETVFEKTCMGDITKFLISLNQSQREKTRREKLIV